MTNEYRDDEKIEETLRKMPEMTDARSKESILARLHADERLQSPVRKKRLNWMPVAAAIAAVLLISFLIPSYFSNEQAGNEMKDQASPVEKRSMNSEDTAEPAQNNTSESAVFSTENSEEAAAVESGLQSHILLDGEYEGFETMPIGVTEQANVIPAVVLIPKERILNDLGTSELNAVSLYNLYAKEIPEEELGFDDYHPYKGIIEEENNEVYHYLSDAEQYDLSEATFWLYKETMRNTFFAYHTIRTVHENGDPFIFEQIGEPDPIQIDKKPRQLPYYRYVLASGNSYLVPAGSEAFSTVQEAFEAMKKAPDDTVEAVVPEDLDFKVRSDNEHVFVTFSEPLNLEKMAVADALDVIESMMLTAAAFNKTVTLENIELQYFHKYDLRTELPFPAGVNPIYLHY